MIGISKLYCGTVEASDPLRYGRASGELPSHLLQFSADKKPVVVWNTTSRCNLKCRHCYAATGPGATELSTQQGFGLIDDLSEFGAPVILFSGGEPTIRPDLPQLIDHAVKRGRRAVISTNGTLIDRDMAAELADIGLSYIGISLDGLQATNDLFRGVDGAFDQALKGIYNAQHAGIKVGLRFTINRGNYQEIPGIFELMQREGVMRICYYHLVYTGRGSELIASDLDHRQTRATVDTIIDETAQLHARGFKAEVLTVDNHADGPYLYLRMLKEGNPRAAEVLELLRMNGGNSSGHGIGCVSWNGDVSPDQFWRQHVLGNVTNKPFSEIWTDQNNEFLMRLKNKREHVQGRCRACRWLDVCGGNFRARAEAVSGNVWGEDPACYLTDAEIGVQV